MSAAPTGSHVEAEVAAAIAEVLARITAACERAGRASADVRLIAVTKTHPSGTAQAAVAAGVADLGENRVAELREKAAQVTGAHWHLIGPVQRNKARAAVRTGALIHTLDRPELADALSRVAVEEGADQVVMVQVNVAGDPAKHGCDVNRALDLVAYARDLPSLSVVGLMTIPPLAPGGDAGEAARPHFARLRALRDEAAQRWPEVTALSMGMSADLEVAVEEGATHVRVGGAIFGHREDPRSPRGWTVTTEGP